MLGLGYIDCKLMVLGTKFHVAKTALCSDVRYAGDSIVIGFSDMKENLKSKKSKKSERKSNPEEVKTEEVKTEEVKAEEVKADESKAEKGKEKPKKKSLFKRKEKKEATTTVVDPDITDFREVAEEVKAEETKPEEVKSEEAKPEEVKTESAPVNEEKTVTMDYSSAIKPDPVNGPDFTLLKGVYYDINEGNLKVPESETTPEPTQESKVADEGRPVTQEDVDILLKKMRGSN